jgi:hypothetical protein
VRKADFGKGGCSPLGINFPNFSYLLEHFGLDEEAEKEESISNFETAAKKWRDRIAKSCPRAHGEFLGLLNLSESTSLCCPISR